MTPLASIPEPAAVVWPLAALLDTLRREGFQLRPDDYFEIDLVLKAFKPTTLAELKALIAPLIVVSDDEQEKFDSIFDGVHRRHELTPVVRETAVEPEKKGPQIPWKGRLAHWKQRQSERKGLLLLLLGLLTGAAYAAWFWPGPTFNPSFRLVTKTSGPIAVGDTLEFAVDSTLQRAQGPRARWRWQTPSGQPNPAPGQPTLRLTAQKAGPLVVALKSQRQRGLLFPAWQDSVRRVEIAVCGPLPEVKVTSHAEADTSRRYDFTAQVSAEAQYSEWRLNDSVVATNQASFWCVFPARTADVSYTVRFLAYPDSMQRQCFGEAQQTIQVAASGKAALQFDVSSAGNEIAFKRQILPIYVWAMALLGACIAGLFVVYVWLEARRQPQIALPKGAAPAPTPNPLAQFTSDAPPFEIPLENRDVDLITRDQMFHRTVRLLRQPAEAENRRLHIGRTMRATMQGGGFPTLVYEPHRTETEYLFLIDRTQTRSQQAALFEYLFRAFSQESVCVERFFFKKTFDRFTNEAYPKGLNLRQLAERYHTNVLIVWGSGHSLLDPAYPVVEPFVREAMADWRTRALLTPVPAADWGSKERALQADFVVLPADVVGQLQLLQSLTETTPQPDGRGAPQEGQYSAEDIDFQEADEMRDYLGEELFQWLAATAVFPRVRWEVVVEMGRALLPASAVNFTNLLKLVRIPWMHEGAFPDHTRLALLKHLLPANEVLARRTLLRMLAYAEHYFPGEHFYDGEKYSLQTVSQFLLHAHQPNAHPEFGAAAQAFAALYEHSLYADGAGLRYLENPHGSWRTLLPAPQESVSSASKSSRSSAPRGGGLKNYLETISVTEPEGPEEPPEPAKRPALPLAIGALGLLLSVCLYLGLRPDNQVVKELKIPVEVIIDSSCAAVLSNEDNRPGAPSPSRWSVFIGEKKLVFDGLKATALVPVTPTGPANRPSRATLTVQDVFGREQRELTFERDRVVVRIKCGAVPSPETSPEPVLDSAPTSSASFKPGASTVIKPRLMSTGPSSVRSKTQKVLVYIQYADGSEAAARTVQEQLNAGGGYNAPGIELIQRFQGATQVKFFSTLDRGKAAAIAARIKQLLNLREVGVVRLKNPRISPIEVWINKKDTPIPPVVPTDTSKARRSVAPGSATTQAAVPTAPIATNAAAATNKKIGKRILWVNYNPDGNAANVRRLLVLGAEVVVQAKTNMQAMNHLREHFDLIISDFNRIDEGANAGIELLREVRRLPNNIPFIIYSSDATNPRNQKEALTSGATFVTNSIPELEAAVVKTLGLSTPQQGQMPSPKK